MGARATTGASAQARRTRTGSGNAPPVPDQVVPLPHFTGSEPCRAQPERFFHDSYNTSRPEIRSALKQCRHCPLAPACLVWALANPELATDGIWGATTPRQRSVLRTRIRARLTDTEANAAFRRASTTVLAA